MQVWDKNYLHRGMKLKEHFGLQCLIEENYNNLVVDTHLDSIEAGAEVILLQHLLLEE